MPNVNYADIQTVDAQPSEGDIIAVGFQAYGRSMTIIAGEDGNKDKTAPYGFNSNQTAKIVAAMREIDRPNNSDIAVCTVTLFNQSRRNIIVPPGVISSIIKRFPQSQPVAV